MVARIDRLSRRVALASAMMDSDIQLAVADSPTASRIVFHIKAACADRTVLNVPTRGAAALALGPGTIEKSIAANRVRVPQWVKNAAPTIWSLRAVGRR